MKLVSAIGVALALALVVLALLKLRVVALFRADVAICIWAFGSALGLIFGLYALYRLLDRIRNGRQLAGGCRCSVSRVDSKVLDR